MRRRWWWFVLFAPLLVACGGSARVDHPMHGRQGPGHRRTKDAE